MTAPNLYPIVISRHANERRKQLGLDVLDVVAIVREPEVAYEQPRRGPGNWCAKRGRFSVGYEIDRDRLIVKTVLLNTTDEYVRLEKAIG